MDNQTVKRGSFHNHKRPVCALQVIPDWKRLEGKRW